MFWKKLVSRGCKIWSLLKIVEIMSTCEPQPLVFFFILNFFFILTVIDTTYLDKWAALKLSTIYQYSVICWEKWKYSWMFSDFFVLTCFCLSVFYNKLNKCRDIQDLVNCQLYRSWYQDVHFVSVRLEELKSPYFLFKRTHTQSVDWCTQRMLGAWKCNLKVKWQRGHIGSDSDSLSY